MLIDKARELGIMLCESSEFMRLSGARQSVEQDEALSALLDEFKKKRERLVACFTDGDGAASEAVSLTDDIERLRGQLIENPLFNEMLSAEEAFKTLIASINEEINACIGLSSGCTHDCSSCGGCAH